ncbi:Lrp/AsnC family transcriptional regulator [Actinoplanes sp. L3-i22]|uniref:Lrp/AsnC family transcriptional regulator n=1 Tax=Actinoplanes sp. L3-i22 TaxID=2836373 RepID=UPI001C77CD89|nr:Lrp/AsnC family transcriptional regulator [Actinoplanes sp. L3-i22]BCY09570.1 transcriptional regulator [Actinoplanes sp. L3-i22]
MASELDDIDRHILAELGRDGRMSIRQLSETLHISRANAYARVQRLRETNVITGFRAEIDHAAAGLGTSAYVTVNLHQAEWREVGERLRTLPGVVHIALVGGEFDVIMLVRAKDNTDLRRLVLDEIQGMPGVVNTRTLLVFEEFSPPAAPA